MTEQLKMNEIVLTDDEAEMLREGEGDTVVKADVKGFENESLVFFFDEDDKKLGDGVITGAAKTKVNDVSNMVRLLGGTYPTTDTEELINRLESQGAKDVDKFTEVEVVVLTDVIVEEH